MADVIPTQFQIDCALMAGAAYISTRNVINQIPVPSAWLSFKYQSLPDGFEAVSFRQGSNIVISFAGTGTGIDWVANIGSATGATTSQLVDAAIYYLQVKAANPGFTISFTGHSLGGGLASLMAVFFNQQAVTFDQAPFANAASILVASPLEVYLLASGYSTSDIQGLTNFIASSATQLGIPNASNVTDINVQGEALSYLSQLPLVSRIGTQTDIPDSASLLSTVDLHSQALLSVFLLSSQTAASGQALNDVTFKLTDLLGMIFDSQLFFNDPNNKRNPQLNLIEKLVQHQEGFTGIPASVTNGTPPPAGSTTSAIVHDAMLTRFTADLWAIAKAGGLTMSDKHLTDALIAFDMQKYYYEQAGGPGASAQLFSAIAGGIQFDTANILSASGSATPITQDKGYSQYFSQYLRDGSLLASGLSNAEIAIIQSLLPTLRDWYVQAGAGAMDATDTGNLGAFMLGGAGNDILTGGAGNDVLVDGSGNDILTGGAGNNVLMAGSGNDTFIGGQGNDTLYGGVGNNTFNYVTSGSAAIETIIDPYGNGSIEINGTQLIHVATLLATNQTGSTWRDSNGDQYQFVISPTDASTGTLTITKGLLGSGSGNQIIIQNFDMKAAQTSAGYLGIKFAQQLALQADTSATSPFATGFPSDQSTTVANGDTKSFTVYATSASATDQTIQLALSGGGSYAISTGASLIPLSGTVNLVIPAGQDHATFTLVDLSNGDTPDTAKLTASLTDASGTVSSNNLTVTFNDPAAGTSTNTCADNTLNGAANDAGYGNVFARRAA